MGKRIIARARGHGGPRYRVPSHRYAGKVSYSFSGNAKVVDIIHDPARDKPLAKLKTERGEKLVIAAEGIKVGDNISVKSGSPNTGNILPISLIPKGSMIFAIETFPGSGPRVCNSSYATIISHEPDRVIIQLPSKAFKN